MPGAPNFGHSPTHQRLICLTRTGPEAWHEEEIEDVCFVPLIGEQGWPEEQETYRQGARREARPGVSQARSFGLWLQLRRMS